MTLDPALIAVAGALSTVAGLLYRELVRARDEAKADAAEWEARYFRQVGMTDIATDEVEKRSSL